LSPLASASPVSIPLQPKNLSVPQILPTLPLPDFFPIHRTDVTDSEYFLDYLLIGFYSHMQCVAAGDCILLNFSFSNTALGRQRTEPNWIWPQVRK